MATSPLVSTVVTGAVLLVILAFVLRLRDWQHPTPSTATGGVSGLARAANGPLGWSIAFFLGAFGLMGLGMLYASGEPALGLDPGTLGLLVMAVLAAVVGVGAVAAVYAAVRSRGLNEAQAAAVAVLLVSSLVLVAIVARLMGA